MFKQKIRKNIFILITLFLLHCSSAAAQYEQIQFATGVSAFDVWDKDELLLGDASGNLALFNMRTKQEFSFHNKGERVISLAKIPGQRRALVSFASGMVALFRYDGKILKRECIVVSIFRKHFIVRAIKISPDGRFAIFYPDQFTKKSELPEVWDLENNSMIFRLQKKININTSVITPDSNCVIVHDDSGIISWYRLSDGCLQNWIDVNYIYGQPSKKGFIGYKDIINLDFLKNRSVLIITTSSGNILKIDLSQKLHAVCSKFDGIDSLDTMIPLQINNNNDFFIGSHSLFFENQLILFNAKKREIIECPTSESIKTIKMLNGRLPITLLEDGKLIGWIFNCLLSKKFVFDSNNLEQAFARLDLE
jgi:hypothetical protein